MGAFTVDTGYCGKDCGVCARRGEISCPGCRQGPGEPSNAECPIARCCVELRYGNCSACPQSRSCERLGWRSREPERRLAKRAAAYRGRSEGAESARPVARKLQLLFWLIIPGLLSALAQNARLPALVLAGLIVSVLSRAAYAALLLSLGSSDCRYRHAGALTLLAVVLETALSFVTSGVYSVSGALFLSLAALAAAFGGECYEYLAHAALLSALDDELADKWRNLLRWYALFTGTAVAALLLSGLMLLAMLATITAALALTVLGIVKLVYLYRTADVFRGIAQR